jgi:DNA-3-methyladenine glycosylase I
VTAVANTRPEWANTSELLQHYHDTEWGRPVRDEQGVFERVVLESFQSGLSWSTILKKRPAFREAFDRFDPEIVARYSAADVERLMENEAIVRNRRKILAAINNAQATLQLRSKGGLGKMVWSFEHTIASHELTQTAQSRALAHELKQNGFTFVGPTTVFALMQAIGIAHLGT